ncbi:MAG TPA: cytochrome c [Terrimesophilobacter sp.]|nr:cytochrome c [Terrimesophilobacter sp.]
MALHPAVLVVPSAAVLFLVGCRQEMYDQPRVEPFEGSSFFSDGLADRPAVEGTVPREGLQLYELFFHGREDGEFARRFPFPVTRDLLERGRERYDIYCAICHDRAGMGRGMAVQRGFRPPPSLHDDRLRETSPGYLFDVITNGFGAMIDYADRIEPRDRWAVVAYIRVLQARRSVHESDLPEHVRRELAEAR